MFISRKDFNFGFSFVEIIIVLAIISSLSAIVVLSFSKVGGVQSLEKTTISVISILNEAKSMAVSSKDYSDYGVRVENNKLISFKGNYGNENKIYNIPNLVEISDISIDGVTNNDVIFKKVSGSTNATGTITISVVDNLTVNNSIKISTTGLIEKI
ncbi:MAG: prepilin-type N-terminal cleavage/methylation domain-containing protein [Candidatus Pacebacteria bacterium]|nr:prepilin-type N-terminal cleavage/methylation domain-containing protein [Candidatus Paceibacterota bacterium]